MLIFNMTGQPAGFDLTEIAAIVPEAVARAGEQRAVVVLRNGATFVLDETPEVALAMYTAESDKQDEQWRRRVEGGFPDASQN